MRTRERRSDSAPGELGAGRVVDHQLGDMDVARDSSCSSSWWMVDNGAGVLLW
jgi:hypothetical protein